jgi:hypothetical protein
VLDAADRLDRLPEPEPGEVEEAEQVELPRSKKKCDDPG